MILWSLVSGSALPQVVKGDATPRIPSGGKHFNYSQTIQLSLIRWLNQDGRPDGRANLISQYIFTQRRLNSNCPLTFKQLVMYVRLGSAHSDFGHVRSDICPIRLRPHVRCVRTYVRCVRTYVRCVRTSDIEHVCPMYSDIQARVTYTYIQLD